VREKERKREKKGEDEEEESYLMYVIDKSLEDIRGFF
jgi:hypothetical protein